MVQNTTTPQQLLSSDKPASVLYIADAGLLRRERFAARYADKFISSKKYQREDFDGRFFSEKDLDRFYGSTRTLSLFSENKIIFFKYLDELSAGLLVTIGKEFETLSPAVGMICSGGPLPERSLFKKQIQKFGTYFLFEEMKGPELKRWIKKETTQAGIDAIDEQSIEYIIELAQSSIDSAAKIIEQISLYVDNRKVTVRDLKQLFHKNVETSEFNLVDAILAGDKRKSVMLGNHLMHTGLQPYGFVPLLGKSVFNVGAILAAQEERYGIDRLKTAMNLNPWVLNKLSTVAKKAKRGNVIGLISNLLIADLRLKSKSLHPSDIINDLL